MSFATSFAFTETSFDKTARIATFTYRTTLETGEILDFTETVHFGGDEPMLDVPEPLLTEVLMNLHLVLGLSYWKIHAPRTIEVSRYRLSPAQANFWSTLYTIGMGEFFYRNRLDFRNYVTFPQDDSLVTKRFEHPLQERSLVGIGGGKDSVVAIEALKEKGFAITGFQVLNTGQKHTNGDLVEQLGIGSVTVTRTLDPQVMTIQDGFQGHIPISAIYAFLGIAYGLLFDYRYLIVANEHSASEGNVQYFGSMVNHQWSKSFAFEQMLQTYIQEHLSPDITYFSLLRPLSEYRIVELFTRYPQYFGTFTSCNRNFRMNGDTPSRWCGECPKCAFAFAMFSAFIPKSKLLEMFGKDLFADSTLLPLYRELLGIENFKPWDCVGTPDEVKLALFKAKERGDYAGSPVMRMFEDDVAVHGMPVSLTNAHLERQQKEHAIPSVFLPVLSAL